MTKKELYNWGIHGPWRTEKTTDTQWKIDTKGDTLYIAFQGSVSKLDWKQNFRFWTKPYKQQDFKWYAHSGFTEKWKAIEDKILTIVKSENPNNIVVFGFSQGAGIAVLCHESIWYNFPYLRKNLFTLTCGGPRVIWAWNKKKLDIRFTNLVRVVSTGDLVTKIPPVIFGYFHVGESITLKRIYPWYQFQKNHMSYGKLLEGIEDEEII
jgi:triacylglycerol lipase